MVDGVGFGEHLCVVALGIDADRVKHPLALVEGSTENTTVVCGLLVGLRERGLDTTRPVLVVIDGAKALAKAVREVFDQPVIQRCQLHKIRNVRDHLPERLRGPVKSRMRRADHTDSALDAPAQLEELAKELTDPSWRGRQPAQGPARDPHHPAPGRATDPGAHPALDDRDRIDDLHLPGARQKRQALAARDDGAALVRRGHARGLNLKFIAR